MPRPRGAAAGCRKRRGLATPSAAAQRLRAGVAAPYVRDMIRVYETDGLYWRDLPDWSEQQAAALRALAGRPDLPNALDLENLIEEVEDLGKSWTKAAASPMRLIMEHLIKLLAMPDSASREHWLKEIRNWFRDIEDNFQPSMRHRIDLNLQWRRARKDAVMGLTVAGVPVPPLPETCPLPLDAFLGEEFDLDAALTAVVAAARVDTGDGRP